MKKKSYNPFKMWGSYVGAVLFFLLFNFTHIFQTCYFNDCSTVLIFTWWNTAGLITATIFGFLVGWGMHSLIRFLRKKK